MGTPGKWKKPLSAHYVAGLIDGLDSLWNKWFVDDLKIVSANPWEDVTPTATSPMILQPSGAGLFYRLRRSP